MRAAKLRKLSLRSQIRDRVNEVLLGLAAGDRIGGASWRESSDATGRPNKSPVG
jgi:hypothetical protein